MDDFVDSEQVNIFHHELHQKLIKKSFISKLSVDNKVFDGHDECSDYLEKCVSQLLSGTPNLDKQAQDILLSEVE